MHPIGMPALTIKKFPEALLVELKQRANLSRRSLTQEVLRRLENSLLDADARRATSHPSSEAAAQLKAWASIAGKWKSDFTVEEEVRQLYRARTRGRKVKL